MNNTCQGDYFQVDKTLYYRCFLDGEILTFPYIEQNRECPKCNRIITADEVKILSQRTIQQVLIDSLGGIWVDLPTQRQPQ